MLRISLFRLAFAAVSALAITACQDNSNPTAVIPTTPSANVRSSQGRRFRQPMS
jgi:hypothetical protein